MRLGRFILGCGIILLGAQCIVVAQTHSLPQLDADSLASELAKDSIVAQSIESRKGYVAGIQRVPNLTQHEVDGTQQRSLSDESTPLREQVKSSLRLLLIPSKSLRRQQRPKPIPILTMILLLLRELHGHAHTTFLHVQ